MFRHAIITSIKIKQHNRHYVVNQSKKITPTKISER
nr:MAG TPA: hypothetical protein [Caudoviricetes sp.]